MTAQPFDLTEIHVRIGELHAIAERHNEPDASNAANLMRQMLGMLESAAARLAAVEFLVDVYRFDGDDQDDDAAVPVGDLRDALDGEMVVAHAVKAADR